MMMRPAALFGAPAASCLVLALVSVASASGPSFGAPKLYATGLGPTSVAIGDVNGDRRPDILTVGGRRTVSVLINVGKGRFSAMRSYPVGGDASRVALGDLHGEGRSDVVTANFLGKTVSVLVNKGRGAFGSPRLYRLGASPHALALGDLNGDRRDDVVALLGGLSGFRLAVLLNRGDGSLTPRVTYPQIASSVVIADVDADGAADVVTQDDVHISVFRNRGDGRLGARKDYPANVLPLELKGDTLAAGDLNGDGRPDLAVPNDKASCCRLGHSVAVFINGGDGSFRRQRIYATGIGPESVAIADLNGDHRAEIATANDAGTISVLVNKGDGTFRRTVNYATGIKPYSDTHSLAIADLNGDGRGDLVSVNRDQESVSVLLASTR